MYENDHLQSEEERTAEKQKKEDGNTRGKD